MKVSLDEVRRVAALAHLELDEAAEERLRGHLEEILAYVEQLNEVSTEGVAPAGGAVETAGVMREDRAAPSLDTSAALANAPESGQGHFKVPRILP